MKLGPCTLAIAGGFLKVVEQLSCSSMTLQIKQHVIHIPRAISNFRAVFGEKTGRQLIAAPAIKLLYCKQLIHEIL